MNKLLLITLPFALLVASDTTFVKERGILLYRNGDKCDTVKLVDKMMEIKKISDDKKRIFEYEKLNNLLKK